MEQQENSPEEMHDYRFYHLTGFRRSLAQVFGPPDEKGKYRVVVHFGKRAVEHRMTAEEIRHHEAMPSGTPVKTIAIGIIAAVLLILPGTLENSDDTPDVPIVGANPGESESETESESESELIPDIP